MKKVTFLACAVALLASTFAFTGCKSNEPEGNYNGEVVKTQFAISLPNQLSNNGMKRMPSATVQKDGLSDFQGMTGILLVPFAKQAKIVGSDVRLGANITHNLEGGVSKANLEATASRAKVFSDVSIPLTTGSFLFYAKSAATGTKFSVGSLLPSEDASHNILAADNPSDFTFDLEQIESDATAPTVASASGGKLLAYLSSVARATNGTEAWYAHTANAGLRNMFLTFSTMNGLSSFEVERVLTDIYKSLKPLDASNTLAAAIRDSIEVATYATITNDTVHLVAALANFPGEFDLPEGSVNIKWDSSINKFVDGDYSNMAALDRFVYPAQLWYYANSTIVTSNTSKQTMYDNANSWATVLAAHTDGASVSTKTRAVAINDSIQYAVARFDVQVKLSNASLADNSESAEGVATAVDCSQGFPVSAILVGGQQQVKFDFTSNGGTEYTIYDKVMADAGMKALATGYSAMNHTLVLENGTSDVKIAVEMTNTTGKDFYGVGNQLIPKGGKFYVVGTLSAAAATETSGHVFKQDYTTTAKLTLTKLSTAYNTIPDLRTPQLEIGFSVDLSWKSGHEYTINFD